MQFDGFADRAVELAFQAQPDALRTPLLHLRQTILDTAARTAAVGELTETLKWGEPAYLPAKPRIGSTIRINALKGSHTRYALYVHCQTSLVDTFRNHYPVEFVFDGDRAILFQLGDPIPFAALEHCIALALTYHRWAKS